MARPDIGWIWAVFIIAGAAALATGQTSAEQAGAEMGRPQVVQLYFADAENRRLSPQPLEIAEAATATDMAAQLLQYLSQPPREPLGPVLPPATTFRSLFVAPDGMAYVDLPGIVVDRLPGGVTTELLAVYAIANTLILNSAAIDRVQLLIDGRPAETLAGHIDISRPIGANMMLIR